MGHVNSSFFDLPMFPLFGWLSVDAHPAGECTGITGETGREWQTFGEIFGWKGIYETPSFHYSSRAS